MQLGAQINNSEDFGIFPYFDDLHECLYLKFDIV